jgi:long-chain fatty acid transport protein
MSIKLTAKLTTAIIFLAGAATAGGLDRSGQPVTALFEKGNYAELSFGSVNPSVSGNDVALFGGGASGDVAGSFTQFGGAIKGDINDQLSYAVIFDQPYGADILFGTGSVALGGTKATANSAAVTGLLRYKFNDAFSAYGGVRAQQISADVILLGAAYGGLSGYTVDFAKDTGVGYVGGVAFEKPEIALRVALTYSSEIKHSLATTESIAPGVTSQTSIISPQSVNLDFQTGLNQKTLLFGSIRWAEWGGFTIKPATFSLVTTSPLEPNGGSLVSLKDDTITYNIGVGRKLTEKLSVAVSLGYEKEGNPLVSPLAPTTGQKSIGVGLSYQMNNAKITGGIRYISVGDTTPETGTPDVARANFTDNSAIAAGMKISFNF